MGRWAEVYFTAPPDQREEAVLALLRELKAESSNKNEESAPRADFPEPNFRTQSWAEMREPVIDATAGTSAKRGRVEPIHEKTVICESCGQSVPEAQKFCGMCGASLQRETGFSAGWSDHKDTNDENLVRDEYSSFEPDNRRETVFSFGGNVPSSED